VPTVTYSHEFPYRHILAGGTFPVLPITIGAAHHLPRSADVIAYLDSGAQRSLFDGTLAGAIGLDLLAGRRLTMASTAGFSIDAIVHPVRLSHPDLGDFNLEIGFSTVPCAAIYLGGISSTSCRLDFASGSRSST
jgi:hypothetical protein